MVQSPTPPTKPIPPTPPSMKASSADTASPAATSLVPPAKATVTAPSAEKPTPAAAIPSANNNVVQPYSTSTTKDANTETVMPTAAPLAPKSSSTFGFSLFFIAILLTALAAVAIHWWKNNKTTRKTVVDYSTESPDDIVNLILSDQNADPIPQAMPKARPKKPLPKKDGPQRPKGGFDVSV